MRELAPETPKGGDAHREKGAVASPLARGAGAGSAPRASAPSSGLPRDGAGAAPAARTLTTEHFQSDATSAAAAARDGVAGARVLIVDDSEANRRFATFMARRLGCASATASDGDEVVGAVAAAHAAGLPVRSGGDMGRVGAGLGASGVRD